MFRLASAWQGRRKYQMHRDCIAVERHAEAARLHAIGFKLCALHPMSKQPFGDGWQLNPVAEISDAAGGYGVMLAANGLCSIDPDNVEAAREGFRRCGFDLDEVMAAGVRTTSTRPGSGGRSTFKDAGLQRVVFSSKVHGTILELRAGQSNLQDCLPGTVYLGKGGAGPYEQAYANGRTLDDAPELPPKVLAWWRRMNEDVEFKREQQRLFAGPAAVLAVSTGSGKGVRLAFPSSQREAFNAANDVATILERHGYTTADGERWAPPTATGAPCVRRIPGKTELWQSDHASDPLLGTFDAWTAHVVLDHDSDLTAAEHAIIADHFVDVRANARARLEELIEGGALAFADHEELLAEAKVWMQPADLAKDELAALLERLQVTVATLTPAVDAEAVVNLMVCPAAGHPVALDLLAIPEDPPDPKFVIPGWMPDGVVTLFAAHGGTGKSFLSLYVALCLATGRHPFAPGETIQRVRVVVYSAEDDTTVMQGRLRRYMRLLGIEAGDLVGWLLVLDATQSDNVLFAGDEKVHGRTTKRFTWLRKEIEAFGGDVLIFDNASDAMDANENDRAKVRQFMSVLKRLASAVLLLAHVDAVSSMASVDEAKGYSGSTGWHNSARSRWFMARDKDTDDIVLSLPKVNYARAGSQALIRWSEEHRVFDVVQVRDGKAKIEDIRPVLLDLVRQATEAGINVSPATTTTSSAWNIIKQMEGCPPGLKSAQVAKEVMRWRSEGLVRVETYRAANRKDAERLVLTAAGLQACIEAGGGL